MNYKEPSFWWKKTSGLSRLLWPVSFLYGLVAARNIDKQAPAISMPVLCVGNFTLGGTGKTPTVIALATTANKMGLIPGIVSRGYGIKNQKLHLVDPNSDTAQTVGDEPLLLSRHARVVVGSDRFSAAQRLQESGCNFILMDDGFQSRRLLPDLALLVVDGMRGLGNGKVFPAGPLRAPLIKQLSLTDNILVIGQEAEKTALLQLTSNTTKPLEQATLQPFSNLPDVKGICFFAFSGIGNPKKFHRSIREMGGIVKEVRNFPDHYFFKNSDLQAIAEYCIEKKITPATTAKDYVRLVSQNQTGILNNLAIFDINITFSTNDFCSTLIKKTIENHKARHKSTV